MKTIAIARVLAVVCICTVLALGGSNSVAAQIDGSGTHTHSGVFVRPNGEESSFVLHRTGAQVVAMFQPFSFEDGFVLPEGYRPMSRIHRKVEGYLPDPVGGKPWRSDIGYTMEVHPDGRFGHSSGAREYASPTLQLRSGAGAEQITMEWFTATEAAQGEFDNLAEHHQGMYQLAKGGVYVSARLSSSRSPIQHYARVQPVSLFTVPEGFRPAVTVTRAVVGTAVHADGSDTAGRTEHVFRVRISPDGDVTYVDAPALDGVGYLGYAFEIAWETRISQDRRVLEDMLDTADLDNVLRDWGRFDVPLEDWRGVGTNADGRVTHLNLSGVGLRGRLPSSFGDLSELREAHFGWEGANSANQLTALPDDLEGLANLQVLDLSNNPIDAPFPPAWSRLHNLKSLNLRGTKYHGQLPSAWAALLNLEVLDLVQTGVAGVLPPEWSGMPNLQRLLITSASLGGSLPEAWHAMPRLKVLDIRGTGIEGPLPAGWSRMPNLETLILRNQLSGSLPPEWGTMPNLRYLDLGHNRLSGPLPHTWSRLEQLEVLWLEGNDLIGFLPVNWKDLGQLRVLSLSRNRLHGLLPPEWGAMPNLRYLDLGSNQLAGSLPRTWSRWEQLEVLWLGDNNLIGFLPVNWKDLGQLRVLSLSGNRLHGLLPTSWHALDRLESLRLSNNALVGGLPPQWSRLQRLEAIRLDGNGLSGTVPESWLDMDNLRILDLGRNAFTECLPAVWQPYHPRESQAEVVFCDS